MEFSTGRGEAADGEVTRQVAKVGEAVELIKVVGTCCRSRGTGEDRAGCCEHATVVVVCEREVSIVEDGKFGCPAL